MNEQRRYDEYTETPDIPLDEQIAQEQAEEERESVAAIIKTGKSENTELPRFLWYPYIPRKEVTVLFGKQGTGKGFAGAVIGAAVSNGERPLSSLTNKPEKVLVISAEETDGDIERKYRYSGANMDNIGRIGRESALNDDDRPRFNIAERPQELEQGIKDFGAGLVIIDPIQDFIGVKNLNAAEEVGAALVKLNRIAEHCDCAIVFYAHPSKKSIEIDAIDAVAGSAEFTRKPRSVLQIVFDETGENPNRRVIVHIKHNGTVEGDAIAFTISTVDESEIAEPISEETAPPARAQFTGYSPINADIVSAAAARKKKLSEYLDEHPIDTPSSLTLATNTLVNLAEKNALPLLLSRKGLQEHFPDYFRGTFPALVAALKPKMYERGYYIEYTNPIGQNRKDHFGYSNQRCVKVTRVPRESTL